MNRHLVRTFILFTCISLLHATSYSIKTTEGSRYHNLLYQTMSDSILVMSTWNQDSSMQEELYFRIRSLADFRETGDTIKALGSMVRTDFNFFRGLLVGAVGGFSGFWVGAAIGSWYSDITDASGEELFGYTLGGAALGMYSLGFSGFIYFAYHGFDPENEKLNLTEYTLRQKRFWIESIVQTN